MDYDEFVRGIRGGMGEERLQFVKMAFDVIDDNKNGTIELKEIGARYDVSKHPDVLAGKITEEQALQVFLRNWDKDGDDQVTMEEFVEYYEWISSSIDNDDYFELMMRNG